MSGPGWSLWTYRALLRGLAPLAAPLLCLQARLQGKHRPAASLRLARGLPALPPEGLWLQAVSVGEVELGRRLVAELRQRLPRLPLLVTATTHTGLELARRSLAEQLQVLPCPLDLPRPIGRVLEAAAPRGLVLVETELWPELLYQTGRRGIPVAVVNARLSEGSFARYRRVGAFLRPLLRPVSMVLARAEADATRFARLGVPEDRIRVTGNIKYDLVPSSEPLPWHDAVQTMAGGRPIVVAGSTMEGEEEQVLTAFARLKERGHDILLVIAPRHPERFDRVAELIAERGVSLARRSRLAASPPRADVFLLDTIGELARAYKVADAAFIGGSLATTGGHNPLEAAVWGVPVLTGPHVHNFREVYDELVGAGGGRVVGGADDLASTLAGWLAEEGGARPIGAAGRAVVDRNRGATARTVDELMALFGLAAVRGTS